MSYLERYLAGEHEQVWAELVALGPAVREEPVYSDALAGGPRDAAACALEHRDADPAPA